MRKILLFMSLAAIGASSCQKELKEVPMSFYTPENSYVTKPQYESALSDIYRSVRTDMYARADAYSNYDMLGLDVDLANIESNGSATKVSYFGWTTMTPDNGFASAWWTRLYSWVAKSNTIIDRADGPQCQMTATEKSA